VQRGSRRASASWLAFLNLPLQVSYGYYLSNLIINLPTYLNSSSYNTTSTEFCPMLNPLLHIKILPQFFHDENQQKPVVLIPRVDCVSEVELLEATATVQAPGSMKQTMIFSPLRPAGPVLLCIFFRRLERGIHLWLFWASWHLHRGLATLHIENRQTNWKCNKFSSSLKSDI
jgi:hypothetical protein